MFIYTFMKRLLYLFLFLLFAAIGQAQDVLSQRLSMKLDEVSLEVALYALTDEADVNLTFSNRQIPDVTISLNSESETLASILGKILKGTNLHYQEHGGHIVILPATKEKHTISGFLKDSSNGELLLYANIVELNSKLGTASNSYGFYSLTLPEGTAKIAISYTGYKTEFIDLAIEEDVNLDISLKPSLTLQPVEIIGNRYADKVHPVSGDGLLINMAQVDQLPSLAGEADLIRTLHLLPGVQTGTDGVGGLHIRGGNNGHNLMMIDGVPVYNISHAAGLFSIFNTEAVSSAVLHKGAFPARYGGRLSSVLDIRTKEGSRKEWGVKGDIGTLAGRLTVDGPIVKDKSSLFLSGRFSLVDWYLGAITQNLQAEKGKEGFIDYHFHDINAKWSYDFSRKNKLYLSYYSGADRYSNRGTATDTLGTIDAGSNLFRYDKHYSDEVRWGNQVGAIRWNHLINEHLFANLTATYSSLNVDIAYASADSLTGLSTGNTEITIIDYGRYRSEIEDIGLRLDFDYAPLRGNHFIRFGINAIHHSFTPGVLSYYKVKEGVKLQKTLPTFVEREQALQAWQTTFYIEDEVRIGDRLNANIGLHANLFNVRNTWYPSIQPRLSVHYQAGSNWSLSTYYSRMSQPIHLLSNSLLGLPTELWIPSTDNIAPQRSWQTGIGANWRLRRGWQLESEIYYKSMKGLLSYSEGAQFLDDWEQNVTQGTGTSYGLEVSLRKTNGITTGWIGYGLLWADRTFERINRGNPYPYRYDRRHEVKIAVIHKVQNWLELTGSWTLSSGSAFSLPAATYTIDIPDAGTFTAIDYGTKNAYRLPYYHKLDVSANVHIEMERIKHTIKMGVYNLYNRHNPLYYDIRSTLVHSNGEWHKENELVDAWLIPLLPALSYSIRF